MQVVSSKIEGMKIPYGYCHCGCGNKTALARQTYAKIGHVRNQPVKFVRGHNSAKPRHSLDGLVLAPGTQAIPLTQNKYVIVDAADFDWLSSYRWHYLKAGYAIRGENVAGIILMHRVILNAPDDLTVDHIDGNGLNNTRANLRVATQGQNLCNRPAKSGFKGVDFQKRNEKWRARIKTHGKEIHIGEFATDVEAARAYDEKAKQIQGEFARLNFPGGIGGTDSR